MNIFVTYQGTHVTLTRNCGFTPAQAKQIEAKYHELYQVSDAWANAKIEQATKDGYTTVAFGLRVRTPILKQSILGNSATLKLAGNEARTVGNAFVQSYGLLNNRACSQVMERARYSVFAHDIRPCSLIHDAQYYLVRNTPEAVLWLHTELIDAVSWADLPELKHPSVGLSGDVSLFIPNWSYALDLPEKLNKVTLVTLAQNHHF